MADATPHYRWIRETDSSWFYYTHVGAMGFRRRDRDWLCEHRDVAFESLPADLDVGRVKLHMEVRLKRTLCMMLEAMATADPEEIEA